MADIQKAALKAEAALAAFLAEADGRLWEGEERSVRAALGVVRDYAKRR